MLDSATDGSAVIGHGRYRLGLRLGGGGSSDVYRAVDTVLQRPVAVKLFRACADPTAELRFQAEARLLAPLAHPALVTIYDTGVEQGRAYQVLELVEGRTLRDRLVNGPLGPDDVMAIGVRLSEALAYVHGQGIVHRDIKPSNVLGDSDQVYLADFGISRLLDGAHLTATGMAVGTAAYMAPEQVRGGEVGPPADVYSLGLVLLESLTGHREYAGGVTETAMARLSRPPLVPTWLPAPLATLLTAMTRDDPRERPSAEACAAALRDGVPVPSAVDAPTLPAPDALPAADSEEPGTGTLAWPTPLAPVAGSEPARGSRRRWGRIGLAAIALASALVVGVLATVDGDKPDQAPADTNSTPTAPAPGTPTAPRPGTPTQQADPGGETGNSPRVVVPPPTGKNPPVTTEPSPSQEPTETPSASPSSSDDSDEDDDDSSGHSGNGDDSDRGKKGKGNS